ncbi:hypothetical protein LZ32DRAFT_602978 [Colletotrichum eremochloae]|nr:hypothetical protein LZ32DRAFT_602978 [Colletotrichum eremochloae]
MLSPLSGPIQTGAIPAGSYFTTWVCTCVHTSLRTDYRYRSGRETQQLPAVLT